MSRTARSYVIASAGMCAVGAVVHLIAILLGARWHALIGAPLGLIEMLERGSARPAVTCLAIAAVLAVWSAYGFSAAGLVRKLPARRTVLALVAAVLIARSIVLPTLASYAPAMLIGACGRCQQLNWFVLVTSALCLFVGVGYAVAALRPTPNNSSKPTPLRGAA